MVGLASVLRSKQADKASQAKQATDGEQYWTLMNHFHSLCDDHNKSANKYDDGSCFVHFYPPA
jgi:hypothetical protein